MPNIERRDIDAIRERVNFLELVTEYAGKPAKSGGGKYWWHCPAHGVDKTPSFMVEEDHAYCFVVSRIGMQFLLLDSLDLLTVL